MSHGVYRLSYRSRRVREAVDRRFRSPDPSLAVQRECVVLTRQGAVRLSVTSTESLTLTFFHTVLVQNLGFVDDRLQDTFHVWTFSKFLINETLDDMFKRLVRRRCDGSMRHAFFHVQVMRLDAFKVEENSSRGIALSLTRNARSSLTHYFERERVSSVDTCRDRTNRGRIFRGLFSRPAFATGRYEQRSFFFLSVFEAKREKCNLSA